MLGRAKVWGEKANVNNKYVFFRAEGIFAWKVREGRVKVRKYEKSKSKRGIKSIMCDTKREWEKMTLKYFWPVLARALENVSSVYQKTKMFIKIHVYIPAFISVSGTSRRNTSESHFRPLSRQDFFPLQTYFFLPACLSVFHSSLNTAHSFRSDKQRPQLSAGQGKCLSHLLQETWSPQEMLRWSLRHDCDPGTGYLWSGKREGKAKCRALHFFNFLGLFFSQCWSGLSQN